MRSLLLISSISLVAGVAILLSFEVNTLFLAALLITVLVVKMQKNIHIFDKLIGVWFALSVAPAATLSIDALRVLENGFVIQASLSWLFFLLLYTKKPSLIQKIYESKNRAVGVMTSGIIVGFAAGILSASLWQSYLWISTKIAS